jgi:hypothetical protein
VGHRLRQAQLIDSSSDALGCLASENLCGPASPGSNDQPCGPFDNGRIARFRPIHVALAPNFPEPQNIHFEDS